MTDLATMLEAFDDYIDSHEHDKAKAEDKKRFVHEQCAKFPEFFAKAIVKTAMDAAEFKYG